MLIVNAVPRHVQVSNFWRPLSWPDLLHAYKPKTRQHAPAHVFIATVLAFICWHPKSIAFFPSAIASIYIRLKTYSALELDIILVMANLAMLCIQIALPGAYLWVIRYWHLHAAASQEVSLLQADIQDMIGAAATLRKPDQAPRHCHVEGIPHPHASLKKPGHLCHARSDPVQQGDDIHLPQPSPLGYGNADGNVNKQEPTSAEGHLAKHLCQPVVEHLEHASAPANNGKILQMQLPPAGPPQPSFPLRPVALNEAHITGDSSRHAPEEPPGLKQQQTEAFELQVAAALQCSSQVIANLTARLEAVVLHKSGAYVQGYEGCTAALRV